MEKKDKKYYTKQEICEHFFISLSTLNREMKKGIPYKKIGGSVRFELDKVEEYYNKEREK